MEIAKLKSRAEALERENKRLREQLGLTTKVVTQLSKDLIECKAALNGTLIKEGHENER